MDGEYFENSTQETVIDYVKNEKEEFFVLRK